MALSGKHGAVHTSTGGQLRFATRLLLWSVAGVLLAGGLLAWWLMVQADRVMRTELLQQTRLVAESINLDRLQSLTGTAADLNTPVYQRLKAQFIALRAANPQCRFVYLMGRRANGEIFFFVDSEPAGAVDESPPGQVYDEATPDERRVFDTATARTMGPYDNRWGTWVSAQVPLHLPASTCTGTPAAAAVLGMDIEARDWHGRVMSHALRPVGLLVLTLIAALILGTVQLARRGHRPGALPRQNRPPQPALSVAIGLILTAFAAWLAHELESHTRRVFFRTLAECRTASVAETFRDLRNVQLDDLTQFYQGGDVVTSNRYHQYAQHLLKHEPVANWALIPAIPAADKQRFEELMRREGLPEFMIWQTDSTGQRTPATERESYFPVYREERQAGHASLLGFDLGSEPIRRAALEEALRTGLPTATAPVVLTTAGDAQQGVLIFCPVFRDVPSRTLQGFALAVLSLRDTLSAANLDALLDLEISLVRPSGERVALAHSWAEGATPPRLGLALDRPMLAFGQTFLLTAHARPEILRLHPTHAGVLVGVIGLLFTIVATARKRAELAIQAGERKFRQIIETAPDAIQLYRREAGGQLVLRGANPAAERLLGVPHEAYLGKPLAETFPRFLPLAMQELCRRVAIGELEAQACETSSTDTSQPGVYDLHLFQADEQLLVVNIRDISARKQLEEQLRQAEKMQAIGQLAGGVAHDFNNQLGGVMGFAELLADSIHDPRLKGYALNIIKAATHAAESTQQLLAFGRKGKYLNMPTDIHQVIADVVALLSRSIDKCIEIRQQLEATRSTVLADPTQLQNAILNLGLNARDAMPKGGEIVFATHLVHVTASEGDVDLVPGHYIQITVTDTGLGMDAETKKRLFEPFFTTKEVGQGTGLALASAYGAVRNHGGLIRVVSEPGRGSTFAIYLPLHGAPPAEHAIADAPVAPATGGRRIMLVDDEALILDLGVIMLRKGGYKVVACREATAALERYRREWRQIDLVILDMVMPRMGGRELFLAMRAINPQIKAILSSGYSLNGETHNILTLGVLAFVQKPFHLAELLHQVAEVLSPPMGPL
jgi:PAS domain S-box-containing protein